MGLSGAGHGWGVKEGGAKKAPSLKLVSHILQQQNLAQLYVTHPLISVDISISSPEIIKFC